MMFLYTGGANNFAVSESCHSGNMSGLHRMWFNTSIISIFGLSRHNANQRLTPDGVDDASKICRVRYIKNSLVE